jgi:hypothetical protein
MTSLSSYYSAISARVIDSTYLPQWIFSPVTADLNGDGNQDLMVLGASYPIGSNTSPVAQQGRVFFGDGRGNFTEASASVFPMASLLTVHPRKVITGDFNRDGRLDVFISSHGWDTNPYPGEQNRLYLSQADGTWIDATASLPQLSDYSHTSAVGDINGDGSLDIFVGNGYGGQNNILSYTLLNSGSGQFTLSRANIPAASGSVLDFNSGHHFPGATLADLNGDGYPDLLIDADASAAYDLNTQTAILWNQGGSFSQSALSYLPATTSLARHIDLDTEAIDINGDGRLDLVTCGTQGSPLYDGWFVQVLLNRGSNVFEDVTSSVMAASDASSGNYGTVAGTTWPMWVKVLDFNSDGFPDFAVEHNGTLSQSTPLIWLNDGTGHFTTLKVSDFVAAGNEWQLGGGHLAQTANGYSFITTQSYAGSGGLVLTGLLATQAYTATPAASGPLVGTSANDVLRGPGNGDTLDGGAGTDTAVYVGSRAQYAVSHSGSTWGITGPGSTEILANVERLKFTDATVAIDVSGNSSACFNTAGSANAGQVYRLYQAAFNRAPDKAGLAYWIGQADAGVPLTTIASGFSSSAEFAATYGNINDHQFVDQLYLNVLHRPGESAGAAWWYSQLDTHAMTRQQALVGFSESNENQTALIGVIGNGIAM